MTYVMQFASLYSWRGFDLIGGATEAHGAILDHCDEGGVHRC